MILRGSLVCLTSGVIWGCLGSIQLAGAQTPIVPDNSLPIDSQVIQEGNIFRIQGGTLNEAGTNLFHSFQEFSVPVGTEARFENSQTLESIFTRITGNLASDIDGILSAGGNANLFLLNPNGIIFGENAQLNLGGSFFATTADSVEFDDGSFSASFPENPPLLTLSTPRGLQYGTNPGDIINRSRSQSPNFPPNSIGTPAGLTVRPGRSLVLAGGDVNLDAGNVTALSGRIEIGSLGDSESVGLIPTAEGWTLDYEETTRFGSIRLTNESVVDVSSFPAIAPNQPAGPSGNIQISGNQLFILNAGVTGSNFGVAPGGAIDITASQLEIAGSVEMGPQPPPSDLPEGNMVSARIPAGIFSQARGLGRAGDITLHTEELQLRDGAQISVPTFNEGAAGNLTINNTGSIDLSGVNTTLATTAESDSTGNGGNLAINTGRLELQNGAQISASTAGSGEAGNIQIQASESVRLMGGGVGQIPISDDQTIEQFVPSAILSQVQPGAQGNGGTLLVETPRLDVSNQAGISSSTGSVGNAGDIQLRTSSLFLDGGGQIRSSTVVLPMTQGVAGDGGAVRINTDQIEITGISPIGFPSGIFSQSQFSIPPTPDMAPPNPNILTTLRAGRAGDLNIQTRDMLLQEGGTITADTFLDGQGGSINVTASDRIQLSGRSILPSESPAADPDGRLPSRITAQTTGTGNAGGVTLNSPFLSITDGAQVGVDARLGGGAAGDVTLNNSDIRLQRMGRITGETASGQGGNLRFTSEDIRLLDDSNISTTAGTANLPGDGGNISINTNTLVGLGNSNISANAFDGSGGVIQITTEGLFGLQVRSRQDLEQLSDNLIEFDPRNLDSNDITAISRTNPQLEGIVEINTPEVDPVSALIELEDRPVNAAVDQNPCIQGSETEFVQTGSSGLPPSPNDPFTGTTGWEDLRLDPLDDSQVREDSAEPLPSTPAQIRQAQTWHVNAEGELVLTAPGTESNYRPPAAPDNCSPQSQAPQSEKSDRRPQSPPNATFQVQGFRFRGNTVLSDAELAASIDEEFKNGDLQFQDLQAVADQITEEYNEQGYITSGAYIPPQTTQNRVITVQILEGTLEDIQVRTSGNLNPNYVVRRIQRFTEGPVQKDQLLEALQLLQLDPRIDRLSAELGAGVQAGTNLLNVQVQESNAVTASLSLDNDRSPTVGSFRQQADSGIANLFGIGDVATLSYSNTEGTGNWNLGYRLPINALDGTIGFLYSTGDSRIIETPFEQVDIQADTRTYEVSYRQPLLRQVQPRSEGNDGENDGENHGEDEPSVPQDYVFREFAVGLSASRRDTQTSILDRNFPLSPGADDQGETNISVLRLFQDWTQRDSREVFALRSEFSLGVNWFGATVNESEPDSEFFAWRGQAQWVRRLSGMGTPGEAGTRVLVRGDAQLASTSLVPIEQFSLGGRRRMRGYRQDVLLADSGLFGSAEVQLPLFQFARRQGTVWLAPFVEVGTVWNLGDRANPDTSTLASAGLGLRLQLGDRLTAAVDWGIPLVELDTGNDTLQDNGLYFSIRFNPL